MRYPVEAVIVIQRLYEVQGLMEFGRNTLWPKEYGGELPVVIVKVFGLFDDYASIL